MIRLLLFFILYFTITKAIHFNGGTIRWAPVYPNKNLSTVPITIIQTYLWSYPTIICATNVPVSTPGRVSSNASLLCVTDCSSDGGYSAKPVSIITDCQTFSSSLGMMTSERSVNITLTAGAHFYVAYVGAAWVDLNGPSQSGLEWSIVCFIDLRMRPDGLINTPPVASVVSPQYAIVNQTSQINIPVSDVNAGDDVRCRWSVYTPGSRRRKRFDEESIPIRLRRGPGGGSGLGGSLCRTCSTCVQGCPCTCPACVGTTCTGTKCNTHPICSASTSTVETPGTIASTLSYPSRQPIDECGGICYPSSLPNGAFLSGCTITFTGLTPGTWYAVAIQVEDFINSTSTTPMSSTPVQFLIYVMGQPTCGLAPVIFPISLCFDVQVGVQISFNLSAMTLCDPNVSDINTIIVLNSISGMNTSNTIQSTTNISVSYVTISWTPQAAQLGPQQWCAIAYSDEQVQSSQYCVTFNVITSSVICTTTTSTTSSTTSTTTTITISTSTNISSTTVTTILTTIITTTSSPITSLITTTGMIGSTITTDTATTPGYEPTWLLVIEVSSLTFLCAVCCLCICLYWLCCGSTAKRRRRVQPEDQSAEEQNTSNHDPEVVEHIPLHRVTYQTGRGMNHR